MANTFDGTGWDESSPTPAGYIREGDDEIRDLRKGVGLRLAKEHTTPAISSVGGEHRQGSAVSYVVATSGSLPTKRPDGVTTFTVDDEGRLAYVKDTGLLFTLKNLTGVMTWDEVNAFATFAQVPESYILLRHVVAAGVDAGNLSPLDWRIRPLTEETQDAGAKCTPSGSMSTNGQFTLLAGTYRTHIRVPGYGLGMMQARLYNVTAGTAVDLVGGAQAYSDVVDTGVSATKSQRWATIVGRFTLSVDSILRIMSLANFGNGNQAIGQTPVWLDVVGSPIASPIGNSIFTTAEFWREVS
jgi:hypothetical protein